MRGILGPVGLLLVGLCALGCARRTALSREAPIGSASAALPVRHLTLPADPALPGASLYELELSLVDQRGARLGFDAFRGHRVLVSMFYASCPFACPTLISDLRKIERRLSPAARADLRVLLVSFDPEHDTPAALSELMKTRGLDASRWTLASASNDAVRELAAVLGIKYRKLEKGGFNHTSLITVLDRDGTPLARSEGLQGSGDEIVAALGGSS
jgi:protein SCO1/2